MAKKPKTSFVCSECGHNSVSWYGQCPSCKSYNTLVEFKERTITSRPSTTNWAGSKSEVIPLSEALDTPTIRRYDTGMNEFDRVLGGGFAEASVALIGGEPGIGKSTLILQAIHHISKKHSALYITGEESLAQVASRAKRLNLNTSTISSLAESELEIIIETIKKVEPKIVVVDSIQTLVSQQIESGPGSVSQVRECAGALVKLAKTMGFILVFIGHLTKNDQIAGPRILEHMVDTVLMFENDGDSLYRLVRSIKNRFGAAHELGAFEMTGEGLVSVDNPSAMFLSQGRTSQSGATVAILQEGTRAMLVEIQALINDSVAQNPRRLAVGVDNNRVAMLLGILYKHAGVQGLGQRDVFVNAVGGIEAKETAADLPMFLSLVSSLTNRVIPSNLACFGEIGLTGEVRPVVRSEIRIAEATRQGFTKIMVPKRNLPNKIPEGIEIHGIVSVAEALTKLVEWTQEYKKPRKLVIPDEQKEETKK